MKSSSVLSEIRKNPSCFTWGPVKEIIDVGRYTFLHVVDGEPVDHGYHIFVDGKTIYQHTKTIEQAMIHAIAHGSYLKHSSIGEAQALACACVKLLLT